MHLGAVAMTYLSRHAQITGMECADILIIKNLILFKVQINKIPDKWTLKNSLWITWIWSDLAANLIRTLPAGTFNGYTTLNILYEMSFILN